MAFLKLTEQNVQGKTVLIRADMNVPFKDGNISDDTRIRASLASIKYCLDNGASVIVIDPPRPSDRRRIPSRRRCSACCRAFGQTVGQRRESIERLA